MFFKTSVHISFPKLHSFHFHSYIYIYVCMYSYKLNKYTFYICRLYTCICIYIYIYLMCSFVQGTYVHLHATLISVALDGRQLHGSQCFSCSRYICWKQMIYQISIHQYTFSPSMYVYIDMCTCIVATQK